MMKGMISVIDANTFTIDHTGYVDTTNPKDTENITNRTGQLILQITNENGVVVNENVKNLDVTDSTVYKKDYIIPIVSNVAINPGATHTYTARLIFVDTKDYAQDENMDKTFSAHIEIGNTVVTKSYKKDDTKSLATLEKLYGSSVVVNSTKPDFSQVATTNEGIYSAEDDYGTSYYFRGAVDNNYIKWGTNSSGQDLYWRIIRINGDGSIRMIYQGTAPDATAIDAQNCDDETKTCTILDIDSSKSSKTWYENAQALVDARTDAENPRIYYTCFNATGSCLIVKEIQNTVASGEDIHKTQARVIYHGYFLLVITATPKAKFASQKI